MQLSLAAEGSGQSEIGNHGAVGCLGVPVAAAGGRGGGGKQWLHVFVVGSDG
jgi:hypothetical protein